MRLLTIFFLTATSFVAYRFLPGEAQQSEAAAHNQRGFDFHSRRCLDDASREYAEALKLDPPRELTAEEWALVRRFAPRAFTTPTEFFGLKDFAAILHPTERIIAYHFFWEDDIDFPEDNDPCDHEVVWVQFSADRKNIEQVWTYFHGNILAGGEAALTDARLHQMRPRINVQWGKHGSLLMGWEQMTVKSVDSQSRSLKQYNEDTFRALTKNRRLAEHPIGVRLGWPRKFKGTWNDFTNFSRLLQTRQWLTKTRLARVSRWNNATINQYFLPYNFRPKTEWPR